MSVNARPSYEEPSHFAQPSRRAWLAGAIAVVGTYAIPNDGFAKQPAAKAQPPAEAYSSTSPRPFASEELKTTFKAKMRLFMAELKRVPTEELPLEKQIAVLALRERSLEVFYGVPLYLEGIDVYTATNAENDPRAIYAKVTDDFLIKVARWATTPGDNGEGLVDLNLTVHQDSIHLNFLGYNSTGMIDSNKKMGAVPVELFRKIPDPRKHITERMAKSQIEGQTPTVKR